MYDLIGDIQGHADELVQLLGKLGYRKAQRIYRHPERQVNFLGDFIDRGPQIRQVLEIVRPLIEEGHAQAVMGNHELRERMAWPRAVPRGDTRCRARYSNRQPRALMRLPRAVW